MKTEITVNSDGTFTSDSRERIRSVLANALRGVTGSRSPFAGQIGRQIIETISEEVAAKAEAELRSQQWSRALSRAWRVARAQQQTR